MSDTSEITNGCLMHYDSRHIQVRADFMGICQYNRDEYKDKRKKEPNQECMAKILRLLETLTDHAKTEWKLKAIRAEEKGLVKPQEPEHYPIELSNGAIVNLIYKTFGESTVRNSLNYLLDIGYISSNQEKKNAIPDIWLEQDCVQSLLKLQAQVILAGYEFRPPSYQGTISYPSDAISNPSSVISNPDPPKIDPSGCDITPNNISNKDNNFKDTDKKEGSATSLQEDRNAPANVYDFEQKKTESAKLKAVSLQIANDYRKEEANVIPPRLTLQQKEQTPIESPPPGDGAARNRVWKEHDEPRASENHVTEASNGPMALTARQIQRQLEKRIEEIFALYAQKIGRKPSRSKANLDGALKLAQDEASDEDIGTTIDAILADSFLAKNLTLTFVHSKLDALARKPTPLPIDKQAKDKNIGVSGLPRLERRQVNYG